ncbi:MAG TPA: right-handed parallel beta-helix repeat-containing protein, partial [Cyclobacteriaceae bacterium]|nr:right-handed parallel beta-helix repeat-containing protein [Cyclobacteriaceae bacterium]
MKYLLIVSSFFIGSVALAQPGQFTVDALVSPKSSERIITVGGPGADVPGFTNKFIQFAIDAIASTGGTVKLTAGTFDILSPVHMRSNVDLEGTGPESILKKSDGVQTRFIIDADYGELKLTVENASGFLPGMRIQVTDNESSSCWNVSTALITEIIDDVIYIDSYLIRDYRADLNGLISNASSVIEIVNEENVTISNLTIDGNGQNNFLADGCNSAGILILKSKNATVDNVHVKDFNGEGISWQITENVTIRNSEIEGSGNMGLHPGTGSPLTIIENNKIHDNKVDGLFICWRVHHSLVRGNEFYNNGRFGICTGHKDTDVLFEKNHIHSNAADGVNLRGEREDNAPHRNTFRNNIIENNGTGQTGYGFSVNSIAKDLVLIDNIIRNNKKGALFIYSNGTAPAKMENNQISGHKIN